MLHPALAAPAGSRWELAAALIAVKMRWFGLVVGYTLANMPGRGAASPLWLNAMLSLGLLFAVCDTAFFLKGRLFILSRFPLLVALLEAVFIGLLCYFDTGLDSPFRYYYFLSLVACAVRYPLPVPFAACLFHAASYSILHELLPQDRQQGLTVLLMVVIMFWVSWAAASLALLLKLASAELGRVNEELREHQTRLEEKIAERTRDLAEAQALALHQEKQAAFGLLAAGIAHEVGNPLTSISGLVQMLQRRSVDPLVQEKLSLVSGQLDRIQATLRDLIGFSRPAGTERKLVPLAEVVDEAVGVAKYHKRLAGKTIRTELPENPPLALAARGQVTQALLNLVLNAIDATEPGGQIVVAVFRTDAEAVLEVRDEGAAVAPENVGRLFQPYFTTKPDGTGLGLFMTRKLMEEHGGRVSYAPLVPGPGKAFRLHLPLEPEPALTRNGHVDAQPILAAR